MERNWIKSEEKLGVPINSKKALAPTQEQLQSVKLKSWNAQHESIRPPNSPTSRLLRSNSKVEGRKGTNVSRMDESIITEGRENWSKTSPPFKNQGKPGSSPTKAQNSISELSNSGISRHPSNETKISLLLEKTTEETNNFEEIRSFKEVYFSSCSTYSQKQPSLNPYPVYASRVDYGISSMVTPLPTNFPVVFYLPDGVSKTIICCGSKTVSDCVRELLRFSQVTHSSVFKDVTPESFLVRLGGTTQYLHHRICLEQFECIRTALRKSHQIVLVLENKSYDIEAALKQNTPKNGEIFSWKERKQSSSDEGSISHFQVHDPYEITIINIKNIPLGFTMDSGYTFTFFFEAGLYLGGVPLCPVQTTTPSPLSNLQQTIKFDLEVWRIPRGTRLCITMYCQRYRSTFQNKLTLGNAVMNVVDYLGFFESNIRTLSLWPNESANPIAMPIDNYMDGQAIQLEIQFVAFKKQQSSKVLFTPLVSEEEVSYDVNSIPTPPGTEAQTRLQRLLLKDPLYQLSDSEKELIWDNRYYLRNKSDALPKVLRTIHWTDPPLLSEVQRAFNYWKPLEPLEALELLDSKFNWPVIREYAVKCLEKISDTDLAHCTLQLVQAIQYEPYHDSALAKFLISRALQNIHLIGIHFFWCLKAQMHNTIVAVRYGLILEAFLRGCSHSVLDEFVKQQEVVVKLTTIAKDICQKGSGLSTNISKKKEILRKSLETLDFPHRFTLPLNPTIVLKGILIDQCRVMDSARLPLWIVFENNCPFGKPFKMIFKYGDDLRQDMLTLQMFTIMDKEWKKQGLDFGLSTYKCVATGDFQGLVEVVDNARTIASIQKEFGVNGVFKEESLKNWLKQENPILGDEQREENFVLSCAAYCVATFCLGIGDRHNDNIMITKDGHLFHIDFGHFLGNIKKWAGISRERAPFIFTKDFAYVMGGKDSPSFKRFEELCCLAYMIVRCHANTFINLFSLMLSTGIPELKSFTDIEYLRRAFSLEDENQPPDYFKKLIHSSLNTKATQINFFFHNLAH